jgi:hypothetical protein
VAEYKPDLPEGVTLPEGASIDVENPRFKALHDLASRENLSQSAFSGLLGIEAQRLLAEHERARAAPAPAAKPDFSKMSAREQIAYSLAASPGRRPLP